MSYEVVTDKDTDQFASNSGYADLLASAKESGDKLEAFFEHGYTESPDECAAALRKVPGSSDVKSTASGLAQMIAGATYAIITHGVEDQPGAADDIRAHIKAGHPQKTALEAAMRRAGKPARK